MISVRRSSSSSGEGVSTGGALPLTPQPDKKGSLVMGTEMSATHGQPLADPFQRALALDPQLRVIDRVVRAIVARAQGGQTICVGCVRVCLGQLLGLPALGPATTDLAEQLRSCDAYDVVTGEWLFLLESVGSGYGHSVGGEHA